MLTPPGLKVKIPPGHTLSPSPTGTFADSSHNTGAACLQSLRITTAAACRHFKTLSAIVEAENCNKVGEHS
jgi:hypothetical protein